MKIYLLSIVLLSTLLSSALANEPLTGWKFKHDNHPEYSETTLDDSQWKNIRVPKLLFQKHNKSVIGWYRVHFDAPFLISQKPALLIESIRHADETWINGVRIGGLGETYNAWDFFHTNPQSLPRLYKIPINLLQKKDNVLAIKVNIGFGESWGAMFPGGAGMTKGHVIVDDYDFLRDQVYTKKLNTLTIDTIFAALSIVDLFLIVLLIILTLGYSNELKWLTVNSLFLLIGASAHDLNFIYSINLIDVNFSLFLAMLVLPFTTAMYFWSQHQDISKKVVTVAGILWAICLIVMLTPIITVPLKNIMWYLWTLLATVFFAYSIVAAFKGLIYRRIGSVAQFLGITIYVLSIRSQWLPEDWLGHRNIQIGSLLYRYSLLFAYIQQLAQIRIGYKKLANRLVTVIDEVKHSLARELHDGLGQHLASAKLHVQLINQKEHSAHSTIIQQEITESITDLRRLINGLDPIALDGVRIIDILSMEGKKISNIHSVEIIIQPQTSLILDNDEKINTFRIFQETVANAINHGEAKKIVVTLHQDHHLFTMTIKDNGRGFQIKKKPARNESHGYGFISVNERIALLNGHIDIISTQQKGTRVKITFPLNRQPSINNLD